MTQAQWEIKRTRKREVPSKGYNIDHHVFSWENVEQINGPYIETDAKSPYMYIEIFFKSGRKQVIIREIPELISKEGVFLNTKAPASEYWEYQDSEDCSEEFKEAFSSLNNLIESYIKFIKK